MRQVTTYTVLTASGACVVCEQIKDGTRDADGTLRGGVR